MRLGILPSLGGSIQSQKKDGREGLLLNYYLPTYLQQFDEIHYFSYANEKQNLGDKVRLFANIFKLHRYFYSFLMPFVHGSAMKKCDLFRVMHLNGVIPAIIAKKLYRIPFVTTYGYDYIRFAQIEGHPLKAKLFKALIPFFLKCADGVIVTTEDLKRQVAGFIGNSDKVTLVPNGVDANKFAPRTREEKKQDSPPLRLLYVGRLEKQKNLFFLLDIIEKLSKKQKIELTMVGSGSLQKELVERAKERNLPVLFAGSVPYESMADCCRQFDCFISTSLAEGHPKSLIEAMSCGMICVVSDCEGNRSLICDGSTGFLLPLHEPAWIETLAKIIDDIGSFRGMGDRAREEIKRNFDIHQTLSREVALLTSLAQKGAS